MSARGVTLNNVGNFVHYSADGRIVVYSISGPDPNKLFIQDIPITKLEIVPPEDLQYSFYRIFSDPPDHAGDLKEIPVPAHSPLWYQAIREDVDANTDDWIERYLS